MRCWRCFRWGDGFWIDDLRKLWIMRKGPSTYCYCMSILYCIKLFVWLRILQISPELANSKFQQFYRMQPDIHKAPISHKIYIPKTAKYMTISEKERNFQSSPPNAAGLAYNALEDKYAFGYFQNRSVQRHLKKLLKNAKQLPPNNDTRKIISSLSQKILRPLEQRQIHTIESDRAQTVESSKGGQGKGKVKTEADIYYPYKADLRLKSLEKIKQTIEKKQKQLQQAEEKGVYFPRLKTLANDLSHEKTMQKLIEREDRLLSRKQMVASKFKHKDFMEYLSRVKPVSSLSDQADHK